MSDISPLLDVVVLTWNDGDLLAAALTSVLASNAVDVAVFVVDNGSQPPAAVSSDPRVTLARNESNLGVARGRNQGAALGSAPYLCFLDSDASLHNDALERLVAPLQEDATIALAAPVFRGQPPEASAGEAPRLVDKLARGFNLRSTYRPSPGTSEGRWWDVEFAIGACQVIRRYAFEAVHGLDESFFYGPEDVDFCLRLRRAGWRIIQVADAHVDHPPRRRFRGVFTARGLQHAWAVGRYLVRHRHRP